MNNDQTTNEAQAVGKPVVGDQPAAPAADGSHAELGWLREQLAKFEHAVLCRVQGEKTWRGGTDETWRKVAQMCGGPYMSKRKRMDAAERDKRIGIKCQRDVDMCKAVIAIVEASHPNH